MKPDQSGHAELEGQRQRVPGRDAVNVCHAGMLAARRYPELLQRISALPGRAAGRDQPRLVTGRIERVVLRGREIGEFDDRLTLDWLVAATIGLDHLASEERDACRMSETAAQNALRTSLLRLLDAAGRVDRLSSDAVTWRAYGSAS